MRRDTGRLPPHLQRLLDALRAPQGCTELDSPAWDQLIRSARSARLLGTLAARTSAAVPIDRLDPAIRRHLRAGGVEAAFRRQKIRYLLSAITPHIASAATPCVLLKGAAYVVQGLPIADGRLPADVDVMVPRATLDAVERSLLGAGWQYERLTPYDERYYRAWSHELPPLRSAGQALELDLHHTILPPLGRLKPDTEALFRAAVPIAGTPFSVLLPADQTLLAAAHLFQDSDCTNRLRDLVDIDGLLRAFATADPGFWRALDARARLHHLGRPLWYAVTFAQAWLGTPIPAEVAEAIDAYRPSRLAASIVTTLVERTLPPVDPDGESSRDRRWATRLLLARATWLRMPPGIVARHAAHKIGQALVARLSPAQPDAA
jgi:hypothetical protein